MLISSQNCAIKPPARSHMDYRHRRLCRTCTQKELSTLIFSAKTPLKPKGSHVPSPSMKLSANLIKLHACNCSSDRVWLCRTCGRSIRGADEDYKSIWKWRKRYLSSHGGIGIGIGDGNRGVPCGRGGECANAREVEQEIDCDAEDAREIDHDFKSGSPTTSIHSNCSNQMGPGYARHEIEGIGGVMKKKLVKMVKVGACVPEWESEDDMGIPLAREQDGRSRSWCAWCCRFIQGPNDLAAE